jgi:hypothetical protein
MNALRADQFPGDGRYIGYCTRCGADIFNGPRHRCSKPIHHHALNLIVAAKALVKAEHAYRASTVGTFRHATAARERDEKFDTLVRAIAEHNAASIVADKS